MLLFFPVQFVPHYVILSHELVVCALFTSNWSNRGAVSIGCREQYVKGREQSLIEGSA